MHDRLLHGQGPGRVPGTGGAASYGVDPAAENIREVEVHLIGKGKGGSRFIDDG